MFGIKILKHWWPQANSRSLRWEGLVLVLGVNVTATQADPSQLGQQTQILMMFSQQSETAECLTEHYWQCSSFCCSVPQLFWLPFRASQSHLFPWFSKSYPLRKSRNEDCLGVGCLDISWTFTGDMLTSKLEHGWCWAPMHEKHLLDTDQSALISGLMYPMIMGYLCKIGF